MKKNISVVLSIVMLTSVFFIPAGAASAIANTGKSSNFDYAAINHKTGIKEAVYALLNKKKITGTALQGTPSGETWSSEDEYTLENTAVVYKNPDEDFTILNITDPHFADYVKQAWEAFPATCSIKKLVASVKPDLITVTGDIVCSESGVYAIKRFTKLMDSFGIPWAPVFGNHETDTNCDKNYLADIMLTSEYCLLKKGPEDMGVGNYIVNIAEKDGDRVNVVESLIMMDTHKGELYENQIAWYRWAATGISRIMGHDVDSSVMFHIPCAQYQYAYDAAWDSDNDCWREGFDASGELNEKICCARDSDGNPIDYGFFAAVKSAGTTKNIICGHEHLNNFSILFEGVRLTYTLKVGTGSGFTPHLNGGTKITVDSNGLSEIEHVYKKLFILF